MNISKDNIEVGAKNNKPTLSHDREQSGLGSIAAELAQIKKTNQLEVQSAYKRIGNGNLETNRSAQVI